MKNKRGTATHGGPGGKHIKWTFIKITKENIKLVNKILISLWLSIGTFCGRLLFFLSPHTKCVSFVRFLFWRLVPFNFLRTDMIVTCVFPLRLDFLFNTKFHLRGFQHCLLCPYRFVIEEHEL